MPRANTLATIAGLLITLIGFQATNGSSIKVDHSSPEWRKATTQDAQQAQEDQERAQ